jgi:hypothetical protein
MITQFDLAKDEARSKKENKYVRGSVTLQLMA